MKLVMFSMFDMVALQHGRPFFQMAPAVAIRSLAHEVNTPSESLLYKNPADFQLFAIGEFDDETGVITVYEQRQLLVRCSDLVKPDRIGEANRPEPAVGALIKEVDNG